MVAYRQEREFEPLCVRALRAREWRVRGPLREVGVVLWRGC